MAFSFKSVFGNTNTETVEGLRTMFMNKPLYDYLPVAIPFFFKEARSWEKNLSINARNAVQNYLDETLQLASLLRSLKLGVAKGKGWHIDSLSDILHLYDSVEPFFLRSWTSSQKFCINTNGKNLPQNCFRIGKKHWPRFQVPAVLRRRRMFIRIQTLAGYRSRRSTMPSKQSNVA